MTKINLSRYAFERLLEREKRIARPGPVITISREYGCPSKLIAAMLTDLINEKYARKNKWHWISKEILEETARKLGLTPREIKYIFEYGYFSHCFSGHSTFSRFNWSHNSRYSRTNH